MYLMCINSQDMCSIIKNSKKDLEKSKGRNNMVSLCFFADKSLRALLCVCVVISSCCVMLLSWLKLILMLWWGWPPQLLVVCLFTCSWASLFDASESIFIVSTPTSPLQQHTPNDQACSITRHMQTRRVSRWMETARECDEWDPLTSVLSLRTSLQVLFSRRLIHYSISFSHSTT